MANRYTDSNKWSKAFFQELEPRMKLLWVYLCDNCDIAGLWDINLPLLKFQTGFDYTIPEILKSFEGKIQKHGDKIWIPSFIEFQQSKPVEDLNPQNNAHKGILSRLKKAGLDDQPLASPCAAPSEPLGRGPMRGPSNVMYCNSNVEKEEKPKKSKSNPDGFSEALGLYREKFPQATKGQKAEERYNEQIKNSADHDDLLLAIENYARQLKEIYLKQGFKKAPKQTLQTFLGTKSSGFYWRDYIEVTFPATASSDEVFVPQREYGV